MMVYLYIIAIHLYYYVYIRSVVSFMFSNKLVHYFDLPVDCIKQTLLAHISRIFWTEPEKLTFPSKNHLTFQQWS